MHKQPVITADVIVLYKNRLAPSSNLQILLIERGKDPHKGCWALPGGHFDVDVDESILDCAVRELGEETHINTLGSKLQYVGYFDKKDRDPRGRYVGFCWVYYATDFDVANARADDDAAKLKWFDLDNYLPEFAFDHQEMINTYLKSL